MASSPQSRSGPGAVGPLRFLFQNLSAWDAFLMAAASAAQVLHGLPRLSLTWLLGQWSDTLLRSGSGDEVRAIFRLALPLAVVMVVATFLARFLMVRAESSVLCRMRARVMESLLGADPAAMQRLRTGDLVSRALRDTEALVAVVREMLVAWVGKGVVLIGALVAMFFIDWRLAGIASLSVPLAALVFPYPGRLVKRASRVAHDAAGDLGATLTEQIRGLGVIKGFQAESREWTRFQALNDRYRRRLVSSQVWSAVLLSAVWMIATVGVVATVWFGGYEMESGHLTAGGLLAFCLFAGQLIEPAKRLTEFHTRLLNAEAAGARVLELMAVDEDRHGREARPTPEWARGELELRDLRFGYETGRPVLDGLALRLGAGESVALVAASGGGKSTLAALLVGFLRPGQGSILIDGHDVSALAPGELRSIVCLVQQEPVLWSGTLSDNIRFGRWDASRAEIERAAGWLGLDAVAATLPDGLETRLGEGGAGLSEGQRQRVALARAVLKDPRILILDEATSALDSEAEVEILGRLEPWLRKRTVLLMAHRLSTVRRVSRILVLRDGKIVADGPPARLIADSRAFRDLFADQLAAHAVAAPDLGADPPDRFPVAAGGEP